MENSIKASSAGALIPLQKTVLLSKAIGEAVVIDAGERIHSGILFSVDPATYWTFIIKPTALTTTQTKSAKEFTLQIIPGHCVKTICFSANGNEFGDANDRAALLASAEAQLCGAAQRTRLVRDTGKENIVRSKILATLERHRIPVETTDTSIVILNGAVEIHAPYTSDQCLSTNSVVLARIKTVLKNDLVE
eukprot:m.68179 g.68179  ORF g.68179 m.68179 type:complete len:192 (+) comp23925_c0_seq2:117-692(+)